MIQTSKHSIKHSIANIVQGGDSSFSIYNTKYAQSYHSKSLGAYSETMLKHIIPTFLFLQFSYHKNIIFKDYFLSQVPHFTEYITTLHTQINNYANIVNTKSLSSYIYTSQLNRPIRILDICFGLGYNAMLALKFFKNCEIYSPEQDFLLETLQHFHYHNIPYAHKILAQLITSMRYSNTTQTLYFLHGNALNILESFPNGFFDIVFQDPFSQLSNPELWDRQYFKKLFAITTRPCIITTYAKAKNILESANNVGFLTLKYQYGSILYKP